MVNILRFLIIVLPFVLVPNRFDCFRSIKESIFQISVISIFALSFFETRIREYHNKYLAYFLAYMGILFFRFFSWPYIFGGKVGNKTALVLITPSVLMATFNTLLGILLIKIIVENLTKEQIVSLIKLTCVVTFIVSIHLILQKCNLFQIYGREKLATTQTTGWLGGNRVIGFIGNPMVVASYVAIAGQFNLFFRDRLHYLFYIVGFIGVCATCTSTAPIAYVICAILFFMIYNRPVAYGILGIGILGALLLLYLDISGFLAEKFYSFSVRGEVWRRTLEWWWKMPYTGCGLGIFRTKEMFVINTSWWQVHCEPLQVLYEMGVIGLGLAGLALVDFFRRLTFKREVLVCANVVICGCLMSFTHFPLHIAPTVFILILGWSFKEILVKEE